MVDEPRTGDGARPASFTCHRCGTCCTNLQDLWSTGKGPAASIANETIYRLPTPGGLRVFSWEAHRFPRDRLDPLLAVADEQRETLVALAYELDARVCPNYDDDVGCTIYEERPLVCQAYPLLVVQGESGPEVAISGMCPATVAVEQAANQASRPEPLLARAYPEAFAPALAVPAMVAQLSETVSFLASAEVLSPVAGLDEPELERWSDPPVLDLVDLVEEAGVFDRAKLAARANSAVDRIRARWTDEA